MAKIRRKAQKPPKAKKAPTKKKEVKAKKPTPIYYGY